MSMFLLGAGIGFVVGLICGVAGTFGWWLSLGHNK